MINHAHIPLECPFIGRKFLLDTIKENSKAMLYVPGEILLDESFVSEAFDCNPATFRFVFLNLELLRARRSGKLLQTRD